VSASGQLASKANAAENKIIDVFISAGLKRPEIPVLADMFLAEVRGMKHKNVAAELLAKLLNFLLCPREKPIFPHEFEGFHEHHSREKHPRRRPEPTTLNR
jgi:hypothetical protein